MTLKKKRILITGVSGLLGNNLAWYFRDRYEVLGIYGHHPVDIKGVETKVADILSASAIQGIVKDFDPHAIIHCAALANVDICEKEPELADQVNVKGTKNVANAIPDGHMKLIYISTDAVYRGERKGSYFEDDPVAPQSKYAKSKYFGEIVANEKRNSLIVRTAFFGWNMIEKERLSLAEWIIGELSHKRKITGFKDVFTSSIYTFKLAQLLGLAIERDLRGVYHFASRTSLSKYDLAVKLAELFGFDKSLIGPGSVDQSSLDAHRSKNLALNTDKLARDLGTEIPTLEESLEHFHEDFVSGLPEKIKKGNEFVVRLA